MFKSFIPALSIALAVQDAICKNSGEKSVF